MSDLGILRQIEPWQEQEDGDGDKTGMHRAQTFVGTTTYMAPERIDGREYSYGSDIWSFGLALLTVALGKLPLESTGGFWQVLQSVRDKPSPTVPDNGHWSSEFREFVALCLQKNPEDRPSASELLLHPFLKQAVVELPDDLGAIGAVELKAVVRALYEHVDMLRSESSLTTSGHSAMVELDNCDKLSSGNPWNDEKMEEKGRLISSMEMTKLLLFGDPPSGLSGVCQSVKDASYSHRLKTLADQLHMPLPLAINVARKTLLTINTSDYKEVRTPKATHCRPK